jgi:putative ABC transport system ATP-binding protein
MAVISCEYISKTFPKGNVQAVKGANLEFEKGIHIIMGKSGSGKSTLLNMLGGLEKPTNGKVIYDGLDLYKDADMEDIRKFHFGFIFQAYNLIPEINVKDNIMMPNYIAKRRDTGRFKELVERLGLERQIKQMPETLSGGEQQRAAIARALMNRPKIIFADEPTGNLDEENKEKVMKLLAETVRENDATLIMVTHESDHLRYADWNYYMRDGIIELA